MKKIPIILLALVAILGACTESEEPSTPDPIEGNWQPEYLSHRYFQSDGTLIEHYQPDVNVRSGVWRFQDGNYTVETKSDVYPPIPYRIEKDSVLVVDYKVVAVNIDGSLTQPILTGASVDGTQGPVYFEIEGDSMFVYNRISIDEIKLGGTTYSNVVWKSGAKYSRIK